MSFRLIKKYYEAGIYGDGDVAYFYWAGYVSADEYAALTGQTPPESAQSRYGGTGLPL